jgi:hypothetical protein
VKKPVLSLGPSSVPRFEELAERRWRVSIGAGSRTARLLATVLFFVTTLAAMPANAEPQLSTALTLGVAGHGERSSLWTSTKLAAGFRGELLLGRDKDADFGVGPYVEVLTTSSFSDVQLGGGASLLIPVHPYLPLVLSVGAYAAHQSPWGWEPGLATELFWGTHGYNYHSLYAMSAGIFAAGRYALGDSREVTLLAGGRLDLELIAIPFLFLWGAIRGPNPSR